MLYATIAMNMVLCAYLAWDAFQKRRRRKKAIAFQRAIIEGLRN